MSRRPASCIWEPFVAGLAAIALTGCGGGGHEARVPPPIAASKPAENPQPVPPAAPSPAPAAPVAAPLVEAPPVAAPPVAAPPVAPASSLPGAVVQEKPPDALQWLADSEARRVDYQRRVAEAEAGVVDATSNVATWERTLLAFKNPFLARPKLSPEDAQAIAGMDGIERVHWAEGHLDDTRAARDAAQKTLDELKANPPSN